jgi:hypothetical protein
MLSTDYRAVTGLWQRPAALGPHIYFLPLNRRECMRPGPYTDCLSPLLACFVLTLYRHPIPGKFQPALEYFFFSRHMHDHDLITPLAIFS